MLFSWLRQRRRQKILAQPFPAEWDDILQRNVGHVGWLTAQEHERLRKRAQVFIAEKNWEGCRGQEMTDEVRVTIAAQACLISLELDESVYDRLLSVLVYPSEYFVRESQQGPAGIVTESASHRLGEAWYRGPVVLSWPDVLHGGRVPEDGTNVVFHEFAHLLDMNDREVDGTPALLDPSLYRTWHEVMSAEFNRLRRAARRRERTLLDQYGTLNEGEFFAVITESFFERPIDLQREHPELYDVLKAYYRQDTAARLRAARGRA